MKILGVGDIHGDWGHLNQIINKKQPDLVLQVGDFGWWPKLEVKRKSALYHITEDWKCKGVKCQGSKVLFCDGSHEDHLDLQKYKENGWLYDGVVYKSRGSTHILPDGRVILFMGGANSINKPSRTPGHDWLSQWIPTYEEFDRAMSHDSVNMVVSHTCPSLWAPSVMRGREGKDSTRSLLTSIWEHYRPVQWLFGHWHVAKKGHYCGTDWECLDYPGHGGKWWTWV